MREPHLRGNTARVIHRYRETDADNRVPFVESEKELPEIHASQYQPQPGQCTVQESELLQDSQRQVERERGYAEKQEQQLHQ